MPCIYHQSTPNQIEDLDLREVTLQASRLSAKDLVDRRSICFCQMMYPGLRMLRVVLQR